MLHVVDMKKGVINAPFLMTHLDKKILVEAFIHILYSTSVAEFKGIINLKVILLLIKFTIIFP